MRQFSFLCTLWLALALANAAFASPPPEPALPPPVLMVHYMPWFEADPAHKRWGWHWTMNHFHPEISLCEPPDIASHYHPLLGAYDSNDPDLCECHALLMKFAGIDGAFIDWQGNDDYLDYGLNHRNALQMIAALKRAGLKFSIVYEDGTLPGMIAAKRLTTADSVAHGKGLVQWAQAHWFADPAYLTEGGSPIFLDFGAGYYTGDQWTRIFANLPRPPAFYTESSRRLPAIGGFDWPQPGKGTDAAFKELDRFYAASKEWPLSIPAAFPRFHDIYEQAGVQKSWGSIEDQNGKTYEKTLERALKSGAKVIQIVTWNDWGEGTQIEPSLEFGYRDLETTQRLRRRFTKRRPAYTAEDLRLPAALYALRKRPGGNSKTRATLNAISDLLFGGKTQRARRRLAALARTARASP